MHMSHGWPPEAWPLSSDHQQSKHLRNGLCTSLVYRKISSITHYFLYVMTHLCHTTELIVSCRRGVCVYLRALTLLITHTIISTTIMLIKCDIRYFYTPPQGHLFVFIFHRATPPSSGYSSSFFLFSSRVVAWACVTTQWSYQAFFFTLASAMTMTMTIAQNGNLMCDR